VCGGWGGWTVVAAVRMGGGCSVGGVCALGWVVGWVELSGMGGWGVFLREGRRHRVGRTAARDEKDVA